MLSGVLGPFLMALVAVVGDTPAAPRVRSTHAYIVAVMAEARVRSATFRRLIHEIDATDGIVYVEEGDCHHPVRACLAPIVTEGGGFRFLHVFVDARQQDWLVMSDIAHELQHALEVLQDRHVRSTNALLFRWLYPGLGVVRLPDTLEAVNAGNAVWNEVKAFARNGTTKGLSREKSASE